jgi:hypothetical protein
LFSIVSDERRLRPFPVESHPPQPLQDICPYLRTDGSGWIVCPHEIVGCGVLGSPVNPVIPAVVQERIPDAVLGRVNGAMAAAVGSTSPNAL